MTYEKENEVFFNKIYFILKFKNFNTYANKYNSTIQLIREEYNFWSEIDKSNNLNNGYSKEVQGLYEVLSNPKIISNSKSRGAITDDIFNYLTSKQNILSDVYSFEIENRDTIIIGINFISKLDPDLNTILPIYFFQYEKNKKLFYQYLDEYKDYKLLESNSIAELENAVLYKDSNVEKYIQEILENNRLEIDKFSLHRFSIIDKKKEEIEQWLESKEKHINKLEYIINNQETELERIRITYEEMVKVSEPIKHWKLQALEKYKNFRFWTVIVIVLIILLSLLGYLFIDELYSITVQGSSLKDFIPFSFFTVSIITLFLYVVRIVVKMAISSKHLQTEYEQKAAYTYFYLSLLKEEGDNLEKMDRSMILNTLFSKIDTGLIKSSDNREVENMMNNFMKKM